MPVVAHLGDLMGFAHPLTNVEYLHRLFIYIYIGIYIYLYRCLESVEYCTSYIILID